MTEHQRWWWRISQEDRHEMKGETRAFMEFLRHTMGNVGFAGLQFHAAMELERMKRAKP